MLPVDVSAAGWGVPHHHAGGYRPAYAYAACGRDAGAAMLPATAAMPTIGSVSDPWAPQGSPPGPSVRVDVMCGNVAGTLLLPALRVVINEGTETAREVSPTEFERLGGRGSSKKWRTSIRLRDGKTHIGDWLAANGYDQPPPPPPEKELPPRQPNKRIATSGGGSGGATGSGSTSSPGSSGSGVVIAGIASDGYGGGLSTSPSLGWDGQSGHVLMHPHHASAASGPAARHVVPQYHHHGTFGYTPAAGAAAASAADVQLRRLPGDGSDAVAAMADYLAGLQPSPPLHLLPQLSSAPAVGGRPLDLRGLFNAVTQAGGYTAVTQAGRWGEVLWALGLQADSEALERIHTTYVQLLLRFERMFDAQAWLLLTGRPSPIYRATAGSVATAGAAAHTTPAALHSSGGSVPCLSSYDHERPAKRRSVGEALGLTRHASFTHHQGTPGYAPAVPQAPRSYSYSAAQPGPGHQAAGGSYAYHQSALQWQQSSTSSPQQQHSPQQQQQQQMAHGHHPQQQQQPSPQRQQQQQPYGEQHAGHEPIGSRQGAVMRDMGSAARPNTSPAGLGGKTVPGSLSHQHPQQPAAAAAAPGGHRATGAAAAAAAGGLGDWPGADLLHDLPRGEGVSDLLEGFSAELDGLGVEELERGGIVVDGPPAAAQPAAAPAGEAAAAAAAPQAQAAVKAEAAAAPGPATPKAAADEAAAEQKTE